MQAGVKRSSFRITFLMAGLIVLTACVTKLPAPAVQPPAPARAPDVLQHVLDYQGWLAQQTPESLQAEMQRLEQVPVQPRAQLEKALLLAQRHQPDDLDAALSVAAALLASADAQAAPWRQAIAVLMPHWQADLQEQKRLQAELAQQTQQLRDAQRKNEQLSDKAEQLEQKLDALKSIELKLPKPSGNAPAASLPKPAAVPQTRSPAS